MGREDEREERGAEGEGEEEEGEEERDEEGEHIYDEVSGHGVCFCADIHVVSA